MLAYCAPGGPRPVQETRALGADRYSSDLVVAFQNLGTCLGLCARYQSLSV